MKLKDWQIRAIKTFVQAFGGVLVPEIVMLLTNGLPENWTKLWAVLCPVLCAALAAGISAAWYIILERLKEEPEQKSTDEE